jgi:hypothetical protein
MVSTTWSTSKVPSVIILILGQDWFLSLIPYSHNSPRTHQLQRVLLRILLHDTVQDSRSLLNVLVQTANKIGLNINNTMRCTSVCEVGSIHNVTSEWDLLPIASLSLSVNCLYIHTACWFVEFKQESKTTEQSSCTKCSEECRILRCYVLWLL